MLKIRLQRVGKKHEPVFRLVVCDSKNSVKSAKNIEVLGSYDPRDKNETRVDGEKVKAWIAKGAQVSDTVHNLLINQKIIEGKKINVLPKKTAPVKEVAEAPVEAPAESLDNDQGETEISETKVEETPTE